MKYGARGTIVDACVLLVTGELTFVARTDKFTATGAEKDLKSLHFEAVG